MEKAATWWSKYYASKAKLVYYVALFRTISLYSIFFFFLLSQRLEKKTKTNSDEGFHDNYHVYADAFEDESSQ